MTQKLLEILESKGITVPEHHKEMLIGQWEAYQELKAKSGVTGLAGYDIGLKHIPGGDDDES